VFVSLHLSFHYLYALHNISAFISLHLFSCLHLSQHNHHKFVAIMDNSTRVNRAPNSSRKHCRGKGGEITSQQYNWNQEENQMDSMENSRDNSLDNVKSKGRKNKGPSH
jgi:hypothetical protein